MLISSGKREVHIDPPWMNTSGAIGFSDETSSCLDLRKLGAFVTHPVSYSPRRVADGIRLQDFPGGFLLHTGLPNPGLTAVIRERHLQWQRMHIPVIVHLMVDDPAELNQMLLQLESVDSVAAVELGLDQEDPAQIAQLLSPIAGSELPVIVRLGIRAGWPGIDTAQKSGAAAISLVPGRGAYHGSGPPVSGRIFGPGVYPIMLKCTQDLAASLTIPLVVSGGISSPSDALALLQSGAEAVQLDFALWTNPALLEFESPLDR